MYTIHRVVFAYNVTSQQLEKYGKYEKTFQTKWNSFEMDIFWSHCFFLDGSSKKIYINDISFFQELYIFFIHNMSSLIILHKVLGVQKSSEL